MNLRELVELAGIVSVHSPGLIESDRPISRSVIRRYAHFSHVRIRAWQRILSALPDEILKAEGPFRHILWRHAEATLVDVLAGGLIARVWGAVLTANARSQRDCDVERAARGVLAAQLKAQQEVLQLLVDGKMASSSDVEKIDQLRRKIERWTDLWLGHLVRRYALAEFAYDVERALDFGADQLTASGELAPDRIWDLYFLCVRTAFPNADLPGGIHGEWRDEIFRSMLGSFPAEAFAENTSPQRSLDPIVVRAAHAGQTTFCNRVASQIVGEHREPNRGFCS